MEINALTVWKSIQIGTTTHLRDSFGSCASNFLIFFCTSDNFEVSTNSSCVYTREYVIINHFQQEENKVTLFGSFVYNTPFHSPSSFRIGFFSLTRRTSAVTRCLLPPYIGCKYHIILMACINCNSTLQ